MAQILRKRVLKLPVYFWTAMTVTTLVGVAIGAVLFSATFNAHVAITAATPNLSIYDVNAGTYLATNLQPNLNTMQFGTMSAGNQAVRTIRIINSGGNLEPTFYFRFPGSFDATALAGGPLPDGITLTLVLATSCSGYGGTFDPTGEVCSIPFAPSRSLDFNVLLAIPAPAPAQDLTIKVTITTFDTQF